MSNSLSDKQKYELYQWLNDAATLACIKAAQDGEMSRADVCDIASAKDELGFTVTVTNMKSAEKVTGIYLDKIKGKKEEADLAARILDLEIEQGYQTSLLRQFAEHIRYPIPQKLVDAYIKPVTNKPTFCHKHG